ncbi:MAG: hypothetical protein BMS9Abin36_1688 [Gammaproteobacteria bacterium]|nr:MAG: hypothetical protein BMS9Abin36_1688 [Gammaproteobacteria bacterium]
MGENTSEYPVSQAVSLIAVSEGIVLSRAVYLGVGETLPCKRLEKLSFDDKESCKSLVLAVYGISPHLGQQLPRGIKFNEIGTL